ncbi:MAG: hypothetical protein EP298_01775 [Gammaproteobacteria bacterium]|nr:MAG: hypothetical protein EP298_01775 [Gammaproteobacteria bacterium]UTW41369.1 hypothetical protein KFE69_07545 [bacterium SCSIO 12844]
MSGGCWFNSTLYDIEGLEFNSHIHKYYEFGQNLLKLLGSECKEYIEKDFLEKPMKAKWSKQQLFVDPKDKVASYHTYQPEGFK